ncbi:hypothetical protein EMIT0215P_70080 [Pseudomonas serboccidentalis]
MYKEARCCPEPGFKRVTATGGSSSEFCKNRSLLEKRDI